MNERFPKPGENAPSPSARDILRRNMASSLLAKLQETKSLVENGVIDQSFYTSALNEYRREMQNNGLSELIVNPGPIREAEAKSNPTLLVDTTRLIASLDGKTMPIDQVTVEAVEVLQSGEMIPSREFRLITEKHGYKGKYPNKAVISRMHKLVGNDPDIFEEFETPRGMNYKLNADVTFVEDELELTPKTVKKAATTTKKSTPAPKAKDEPKKSTEKKEHEYVEGKLAALRKVLLEEDASVEEIIDLMGETKNGRRFTKPQTASSLIGITKFLIINKDRGTQLFPEEIEILSQLEAKYTDPSGKFFDKAYEKIREWQGAKSTKPQSQEKSEQSRGLKTKANETVRKPDIFLNKRDGQILSTLLLTRMGTTVITGDNQVLTKFVMPRNIIETARYLEQALPKTLNDDEVRIRRREAIDSISKLMKEENLDRLSTDDEDIRNLLTWLQNFVADAEPLKNNFHQFLSKIPQDNVRYGKNIHINTETIVQNPAQELTENIQQIIGLPRDSIASQIKEANELVFDEKDAGILAVMLLARLGVNILDRNGERYTKFSLDSEVLDTVRRFERRFPAKQLPRHEEMDGRARISVLILDVVRKEKFTDFDNQSKDVNQVFRWIYEFVNKHELLKENLDLFLSQPPYREDDNRKYFRLRTQVGINQPIIDIATTTKPSEAPTIVTTPAQKPVEKVLPKPVAQPAKPVAAPIIKMSKEEEQDKSWKEFEKRDSDIKSKLIEFAKRAVETLPEISNPTQVVVAFDYLTHKTQERLIGSGVAYPGYISRKAQFDRIDVVAMAYAAQFGKKTGFRSRDYKKMHDLIETLIASELQKTASNSTK